MLILDRDGVLLRHVEPYILTDTAVSAAPGAVETVRTATRLGIPVAVVTNQSPLARGLVSWDFVDRVNQTIAGWARAGAAVPVRCYVCPHRAEDRCACRKPQPTMLVRAAADAGVDIRATWMVGDHDTDMLAGQAAGCGRLVHLTGGRQPAPSPHADLHLTDLRGVVRLLTGGRE